MDDDVASADIDRLNLAYAKALAIIGLVDRNDPIAAMVARQVVVVGISGLTDPQEIADAVANHFRNI